MTVQEAFFREVIQSPLEIEIIQITPVTTSPAPTADLDNFLGDNDTEQRSFFIPVLYDTTILNYQRELTGLDTSQGMDVFISPRQLEEIFNLWILDIQRYQIRNHNTDRLFNVHRIEYLEPLFENSNMVDCIAIHLELIDAIKQ